MKKTALFLMVVLALAGCQKQDVDQSNQQGPDVDQRKEVARKLVMKSLADLQNKDLKSTIVDLQTAIKIDPSEPQSYLLLAQILIKVQQYDQAAEFLDGTAKLFPDNGTVFYMLSVANKFAGKKLPAVLAARHSVEVFQAQQDKDNMLRSAALLHELVDMPDNPVKSAGAQNPGPRGNDQNT